MDLKNFCRDAGQLIDGKCGNRDQSTLARLMVRLRSLVCLALLYRQLKIYTGEIPEDDRIQEKRRTERIDGQDTDTPA